MRNRDLSNPNDCKNAFNEMDNYTRETYKLMDLVFNKTEVGQKLFERLERIYLDADCCRAQNGSPADQMPDWFAYWRDGQNTVIREFKKAIRIMANLSIK